MAKWRSLAVLFFVGLLAFAPSLAEARAGGSYRSGGGSSFTSQGSLGSKTYNAPMQRSLTPQSPSTAGQASGYGSYHPFWTGLAGGLFGGWLGSMLFPHWGMGGMGFGGMMGSVFTWLLVIWLVWMAFRLFSRRVSPLSSPASTMSFGGLGAMSGFAGAAAPAALSAPLAIAGADYQAFETILKAVQTAWSKGDLAELRRHMTPEMLSYFAEQLAENQSQGVINRVEQVELLHGDLREAWDEGRFHYASCLLHWRALDYNVRIDRHEGDADFVASGDPRQPSEAAELWTFARSPGGQWLLSAIQQVP